MYLSRVYPKATVSALWYIKYVLMQVKCKSLIHDMKSNVIYLFILINYAKAGHDH